MTGKEKIFRGLKAFSQGFFIGVPICLTVTDNICSVCQVEGISMQPVLNHDARSKDFVLINRWKAKSFETIERGDIVSIISPKDPSTVFIKRIIALEGDQIRTLSYKNRVVRIPRGHCWIEGDNRRYSLDSNAFGSVPLGLVNGVATRIIWPPSRWGKLTNQMPEDRNPFDLCNEERSVIRDVRGEIIDSLDSSTVGESTSSQRAVTVDSKGTCSNDRCERTRAAGVLTHLPQNARRLASDIERN